MNRHLIQHLSSNFELESFSTLPEGFRVCKPFDAGFVSAGWGTRIPFACKVESGSDSLVGWETFDRASHFEQFVLYKCDQFCDGWVPGIPRQFREDTMEVLSGRRGVVTECCRCGLELEFSGTVS